MKKKPIIMVDKPHLVVRVYEDTLEVDLKEGARKKLESVVEAHPALRESLGVLFQSIIPLDVALSNVDSAEVSDEGQLKIITPLRRDITIPLGREDSQKLVEKLNELVSAAKARKTEREYARSRASAKLDRTKSPTRMQHPV
jgi:hypothetical protein